MACGPKSIYYSCINNPYKSEPLLKLNSISGSDGVCLRAVSLYMYYANLSTTFSQPDLIYSGEVKHI